MSFIAIPLDVLLEITRDLDFPDSFHLAATCTTCIPLLLSRSFWIIALNRLEQNHRRPLPCSPGLDISFLPLETLRKMAIHAYKLWRNWSSQSPNPISIHSFTIDDSLFHCLPIPGTRFIIVISRQRFACCETISGECIASMDHDSEPQWTPGLTPHVLPGIWSVGLLYASSNGDGLEFTTIRCDHRDPLAVKFSKTFSKVWTPTTTLTQTPLVSDIALVDGMLAAITITMPTTKFLCCFADSQMESLALCPWVQKVPTRRFPDALLARTAFMSPVSTSKRARRLSTSDPRPPFHPPSTTSRSRQCSEMSLPPLPGERPTNP
ncbi:hypothetical protein DFH09DRAFT_91487 [Mycena vulgaris]|nr:hypothetical protein DFH09DRAFT_91487 [Mycena vulgaris]